MSKCPCPKHKDQFINSIQFEAEKSQYCCNECLVKDGYGLLFNIIDILKALKSPEELLIFFNPEESQQEFLKQLFQFNEAHFQNLLNEYEKQVNALKDKIIADFTNVKKQSEILIKRFQYFRRYISSLVKHDDFKKIVAEFQSKNTQINLQEFNKSEETIHQFLKQLNEKQVEFFHLNWGLSMQSKKKTVNLMQFSSDFIQIKQKQKEIVQYSLNLNLLEQQLLYSPFLPTIEQQITSKLNKKIKQYNSIYMSVKDGLQMNTLWDRIDGKDHLIMFFKSGSQDVFGGYSPCKWGKTINNYVQDSTLASFIFSQTKSQIFPLKSDKQQQTIYSNQSSNYGPCLEVGMIYIFHRLLLLVVHLQAAVMRTKQVKQLHYMEQIQLLLNVKYIKLYLNEKIIQLIKSQFSNLLQALINSFIKIFSLKIDLWKNLLTWCVQQGFLFENIGQTDLVSICQLIQSICQLKFYSEYQVLRLLR